MRPSELGAFNVDSHENYLLGQARSLVDDGYPGHALLNIWNAAIRNARRRVEAFGIEHFLSLVKDAAGRKSYRKEADTLSERWGGVDDLVLLEGARALSILDAKAWKCLETINWMRNHASPAHDAEGREVTTEDVIAFALLLQVNLFGLPLPEPGHSVASLFDPIRGGELDEDQLETLKYQLKSVKGTQVRTAFGFLLDEFANGTQHSRGNAALLFPTIWERANEELRQFAGERYYRLWFDRKTDPDPNQHIRLLELLVSVEGVRYIPEAARLSLYRQAAARLAQAKNASYGWAKEESAAKQLAQFGPHVPGVAFVEVYQEVLSVWCGNHWGRSSAYSFLRPFIDSLENRRIRELFYLFKTNERVRQELHNSSSKRHATELIHHLKAKLHLELHIADADEALAELQTL